jgi:hypothetical protein
VSSYTMTLGEMIEQLTPNGDINVRSRIEQGRPGLFDFDYPFYDDDLKKDFETHFIRRFYMREIGFETEGLFKFNLETWLLINMPYWNKMFESEGLVYDPLSNTKLSVTHNKTNDSSGNASSNQTSQHDSTIGNDSTSSSSDTGFNRNLTSNNPDTRLQITTENGTGVIEYASGIDEESSNVTRNTTNHTGGNNSATDTASGNSTTAFNESENFAETTSGKTGDQTFAKLLKEHREAFLRIENSIFKEMEQLFMLVY